MKTQNTDKQTLTYLPLLYKYENAAHQKKIEALKQLPYVTVIDTIEEQIIELLRIQHLGKLHSPEQLAEARQVLLNTTPVEAFGTWVFYPWNNHLLHVLDETDFITVRTNRNKVKITEAEQQLLATKKIGIVGLSVGQSVALTMALERTCGELRLADFDTLDLSNLNRLRAGLHQLGLPKVIIAAREIAELDPYLKVTIYPEGILAENTDAFLGEGNEKLDILVEVCDGVDIKLNIRKAARSKGIPVIMDTNDKGMVDIERFDLEPVRKLFHGLIDEDIIISTLTPQERMQVLMKMVSFENISDRLKMSMGEIGKTISTWPQLASSVMLGGAATTDVCRRILLNQHSSSGRFYVDFEKLIA